MACCWIHRSFQLLPGELKSIKGNLLSAPPPPRRGPSSGSDEFGASPGSDELHTVPGIAASSSLLSSSSSSPLSSSPSPSSPLSSSLPPPTGDHISRALRYNRQQAEQLGQLDLEHSDSTADVRFGSHNAAAAAASAASMVFPGSDMLSREGTSEAAHSGGAAPAPPGAVVVAKLQASIATLRLSLIHI